MSPSPPNSGPERTLGFNDVIQPSGPSEPSIEDLAERTMGFDNVVALPPPPKVVAAQAPSPSGPWHPMPGFPGYEIGAQVGAGPVGPSYHARKGGEALVAKLIDPRFSQAPEVLRRTLQGLGAWQAVQHPNLAGIQSVGTSSGRQVILMQQAAGVPLDRYLREAGPLAASKAVRVVFQVGQVLAEAQTHGLHHGDIRSSKVYFDGERASLTDPGLAYAACMAQLHAQHGLSFGHPTAMAPEMPAEPTAASDVYALGILFYELLCGKPPFGGETPDVLRAHREAALPPPPPGTNFNVAIAAVILRMTAKSVDDRVPGATELIEAIVRLLSGENPFPPPGAQAAAEAPQTQEEKQQKLKSVARLKVEEFNLDDLDDDDDGAAAPTSAQERWKQATESARWNVQGLEKKQQAGRKKAGQRLDLRGGAKRRGWLLPVMVVLVLIGGGLGLWIAGRGDDAARGSSGSQPRRVDPADRPPPPPLEPSPVAKKAAEERAAVRQKTSDALPSYQSEARSLISAGNFTQARALAETALPADVRATPEAQDAIRAMEREITVKLGAYLEQEGKLIDQLLERQDFAGAARRVDTLRPLVPDARALDALQARVDDTREAKLRPLRELSVGMPLASLPKAKQALERMIAGETTLLENGGLYVRYPEIKALASDLTLLKGSKDSWALTKNPHGEGRAVRIRSTKGPVIVASKIPCERLVDLRARLSILAAGKENATVAVLLGRVRKGQITGRGLAWGQAAVELNERKRLSLLDQGATLPDAPPKKTPVSLGVTLEDHSRGLQLEGELNWKSTERSSARSVHVKRKAQTILFYVERADVVFYGLEVRAKVDARALRSSK